MEVITSINEIKPGEASTLHVHHGEESFYVVEGGMIELKDGKQVSFPAGTTGINLRIAISVKPKLPSSKRLPNIREAPSPSPADAC